MNNDESTYEFLGESEHDFVPSQEEWANAQSLMDEYVNKRKRRKLIIWFFVFSLIMGSAIWLGYSTMFNTNNEPNELQSPLVLNENNKGLNKDISHKIERVKLNEENEAVGKIVASNNTIELEKVNINNSKNQSKVIGNNIRKNILSTTRKSKLKNNWKSELQDKRVANKTALDLNKTNYKNDARSNAPSIRLNSSNLLLPIGLIYPMKIEIDNQIVAIDEIVAMLKRERENQHVVLKKNTWSLRPYVELSGQGYFKSKSNETSRFGWSSLIGLDLMRNNKWYMTLGTGVTANYGNWGLTKDIYYDQSNFGVEFESWKITPIAVYDWTSKAGIGMNLGKHNVAMFVKSHYSIGSYSEVLYDKYSALELKRKGTTPEEPKIKKYWVKDTGLKNPRWDVGITYGRKLRSNLRLSSSLVYRLQHKAQLDGTILRLPDTKQTHVFPSIGIEIGLKYSFN